MITESGIIVAVEADALWVETIRQSTCQACQAQKGCGQRLLARVSGRVARIRVLVDSSLSGRYRAGEEVLIGIPEHVVALGSLQVYLLPLFVMVSAITVVGMHVESDTPVIIAAALGLLAGGALVRLLTRWQWRDPGSQPVLLSSASGDPIKILPY